MNGEDVSVKDRLSFPSDKSKQTEQDVSIAENEDDFDNMEEENLIYFDE